MLSRNRDAAAWEIDVEDFDADDVADGDDIARGLDELVGEFGDVN